MVHSMEVEKTRNKNYRKNESENDQTLSLNLFRTFSPRILDSGLKELIIVRKQLS